MQTVLVRQVNNTFLSIAVLITFPFSLSSSEKTSAASIEKHRRFFQLFLEHRRKASHVSLATLLIASARGLLINEETSSKVMLGMR